MAKSDGEGAVFLRGISNTVRLAFRLKCVARELPMKTVMEGLLRLYLETPSLAEPFIMDTVAAQKRRRPAKPKPVPPQLRKR